MADASAQTYDAHEKMDALHFERHCHSLCPTAVLKVRMFMKDRTIALLAS